MSFKGKSVVVTGGSSGIGLACAKLLQEQGAKVTICGRDLDKLHAAKTSLGVDIFQCDVTKEQEVQAFANSVKTCDALITNAGQGRVSTFKDTTDDAWRQELELKFFSQIYPIRAFKPLLEQSATANIVAVNSLLAYQPESHMVATSAARSGVQNLLKSLATEFAPKIRVNSIVLGLVHSGQWQKRFETREDKSVTFESFFKDLAMKKAIPLQRLGQPEEAAEAILFLASQKASYITGASLEVSGGVSRYA